MRYSIPREPNSLSLFNLRCGAQVNMTLIVDNSGGNGGRSAPRRRYTRRRPSYRRRSYRRGSYRGRGRFNRRAFGFTSRRRRGVSLRDLHNLPKFMKAQINPFDPSVDGVKIPDSNTYPSTSVRIDDQWLSLATDANGLAARAFIPVLLNSRIDHTAATASTWTWPAAYGGGTNSTRFAQVGSNYTLLRPCAHGLRISCSAAPTTITGNLHVAVVAVSDFGASTWAYPTNIADMSNAMFYKKYPLAMFTQQSLTLINKFIDCTATRYIDVASDGIGNSSDVGFNHNGWCALVVVVEGAPASTSVLAIESTTHFEMIPKAAALDTASPAAPFSTATLSGTSRVAGAIPAAYTAQEELSYMTDAAAALSQGMSAGVSNAYNSYVRPSLYSAGRSLGSWATNAAGVGMMYGTQRLIANAQRNWGISGVTDYRNPSIASSWG